MYQDSKVRLAIAAFVLTAVALMSFFGGRDDLRRIADIRAEGFATWAEIAEIGSYRTKNSGCRWWVTLEWRDAYGVSRVAERVYVSEDFARSHGQHRRVSIRYLPNHPEKTPLIDDDESFAAHSAATTYQTGHTMIALFVVGLLYLAAMFGAFAYMRQMPAD